MTETQRKEMEGSCWKKEKKTRPADRQSFGVVAQGGALTLHCDRWG